MNCLNLVVCISAVSLGYASVAGEQLDALRMNTGESYEAVRSQVLALDEVEFDVLLAPWDAMPDDSIERLLAEAVRARRNDPEAAAAFDTWLDEAIANPDRRSRDGRPRYFVSTQVKPRRAMDVPFKCEAILKRQLPDAARMSLTTGLVKHCVDRPSTLNRILALVQVERAEDGGINVSSAAVRALSSLLLESVEWTADDATRNKLIAPVVEWYKRWRSDEEHTEEDGFRGAFAVLVLHKIETAESFLALQELILWEQTVNMPSQSVSPWDNNKSAIGDLITMRYKLRKEISSRKRAGEDAAQLEQELDSLIARYPDTQERRNAIYVWSHLTRTRDKLAALLAGEPAPKTMD